MAHAPHTYFAFIFRGALEQKAGLGAEVRGPAERGLQIGPTHAVEGPAHRIQRRLQDVEALAVPCACRPHAWRLGEGARQ